MSTAWEQLQGAALALARSGPIKDRLADAFRNHLAWVRPEDLPAALRAEFRACHHALTRERPLRGEDAVRATVRKMSNQDADEVAHTVVRLFAAVAREASAETSALPAADMDEALSRGALAGGAVPNGALADGVNGARARPRNGVPQVISLYAAEA
jgi:hypothetical protein